ncbi:MAG: DEAD/DEAH box helicase [Patescibacteria group bacterium]
MKYNQNRFSNSVRARPQSRFQSRPKKRFGENIDVSRFIQKASVSAPKIEHKIENSFSDFKFADGLFRNLSARGYVTPSPIQDKSIPAISQGRDLVGLAQTGTGKTAAFLLPLIHKAAKDPKQNVLIVAPTRELALQIESEFRIFAFGSGLFSAICVGGMPIFPQIRSLRANPSFVVGTPGRLKDLAERGILNLASFNNVVIDEVDHMLDMGFIIDIRNILSKLPKERQSLFFSATMPPRIRALVAEFCRNPLMVEIRSGETSKNVDADIIRVRDERSKFDELNKMLSTPEFEKVLIFAETKRSVERLSIDLIKNGFRAGSIHGDKRQRERARALTEFKTLHTNILVATDVAARGLDIDDITHVINYTIPQTHDDYIHRIGRTGRCGKRGKAYTFVH